MHRGGSGLAYEPALDGLRAAAVAAVLAYHAGVTWAPAGFLGVDVFLVLSGYLITALVLSEWRRRGDVQLRGFWERRARRILPALVLVAGAVLVYATVTSQVGLLRGDVIASVTGVQNWHLALQGVSYFDGLSDAVALRHTWSLALELQWYLVWPLVLVGMLRLWGYRPLRMAAVAGGLALVSATQMSALFTPGSDPSRAYFGSDSRVHVLLIGAVLAFILHRAGDARPGRGWGSAGVLGAVVVAWGIHRSYDLDPFLYDGGLLVVAGATAAMVAAAQREGSLVQRALRTPGLPSVGRISYGIYLWHWPLYVWMGPGWNAVVLSVALAAASYRLVEQPMRLAPPPRRRVAGLATAALTATVVVAAGALPSTPEPAAATVVASSVGSDGGSMAANEGGAVVETPPGAGAVDGASPAESPRAAGTVSRILVAGDSVALTLGHEFRTEWFEAPVQVDASATYLGCGIVDGQPLNDGRPLVWDAEACRAWPQRWQDAVERVDPDVVVVLVGAWEILDLRLDGETAPVGSPRHTRHVADQLEAGLDVLMAADRPAIVLTAPCYRPHDELPGWSTSDRADDRRVAQLNALIHRVVAEHPSNARVADLRERVCPGGGYLERVDGAALRTDGVHFTTEGARYVWEWLLPEVLRQ